MFKLFYILIAALLTGPVFSQNLNPVPSKSEITFDIDTRFGPAKGVFKKTSISGVDFATKKARVEIDVESIDTGNGMRDKHLKNEDFFDVPNHPKAFFEVLSLSETSANSFILSGKLTIKKIEKVYEIPVKSIVTDENIQYSGSIDINRKDFQINYNSIINPIQDIARVKFSVLFDKKGK
ncbi:MAG: YceI family protein [Spirochaetia bacterium]|nr:YceI family protein [Spirochaetia bacterium]